jgi:hypothetical protein
VSDDAGLRLAPCGFKRIEARGQGFDLRRFVVVGRAEIIVVGFQPDDLVMITVEKRFEFLHAFNQHRHKRPVSNALGLHRVFGCGYDFRHHGFDLLGNQADLMLLLPFLILTLPVEPDRAQPHDGIEAVGKRHNVFLKTHVGSVVIGGDDDQTGQFLSALTNFQTPPRFQRQLMVLEIAASIFPIAHYSTHIKKKPPNGGFKIRRDGMQVHSASGDRL